jgi:hypothetical protein
MPEATTPAPPRQKRKPYTADEERMFLGYATTERDGHLKAAFDAEDMKARDSTLRLLNAASALVDKIRENIGLIDPPVRKARKKKGE